MVRIISAFGWKPGYRRIQTKGGRESGGEKEENAFESGCEIRRPSFTDIHSWCGLKIISGGPCARTLAHSCTYTHRVASPVVGLHRQTNTLQMMRAWWQRVGGRVVVVKKGHTLFSRVNSREEKQGKEESRGRRGGNR